MPRFTSLALSACLAAGIVAAVPAVTESANAAPQTSTAKVGFSSDSTRRTIAARKPRVKTTPTPTPTTTTPAPAPTTTTPAPAPAPLGVSGSYNLVFQDEFDGTSLDTNVWTPRRGVGAGNFGTPFNLDNEDAGFQSSQVSVGNGTLKLKADAASTTVNDPWGGQYTYPYTSGVVNSEAGFQFTYGYIETRMWVPDDAGYWPAFWMVAPGINLPEVDIAEFFQGWDDKFHPHINLHWGSDWDHHQEQGMQMMGTEGQSYGGAWHTYGLKWTQGRMETYVDGVAGPVVSNPNVPSVPMFLLLNLSVRKGATPAPATMQVDYVRVWK